MRARSSLYLLILFLLSKPAIGEDLFSMRQINENTGRFHPRVIGGQLAIRKDWPATLRFQTMIANRLVNCTSTIVGDRVIITAAHCIAKDGARGGAFIGNDVFNVTCNYHPKFKGAAACLLARSPSQLSGCTADFAICKSDKLIPPSIGKFESIDTLGNGITEGSELVLLGFGCTKANGPISDTLQVGEAKVTRIGKIGAAYPVAEYTIVTGGSAVCPGDSGGSSFDSADSRSRKVVAINSRGNLTTRSYLVDISDPSVLDFVRAWRAAAQVKVCGLDRDASNCRH
jgi:Trypsin